MAGLNEAVEAALHGPAREDIEFCDYRFHVKRAQRLDFNADTHVWGQISHGIGTRPHDQVYFHITKTAGILTALQRNTSRTEWAGVHDRVAVVLAGLRGAPLSPETVSLVANQLEQIRPDGWEQACDVIVTAIALRV